MLYRLVACLVPLWLVACGSVDASRLAAAGGARYPVVLHHGFLGFDRILQLDYFYKLKDALAAGGHAVRVTRVPSVNTVEVRARMLAEQIDQILAETGAAKVNIIAHSMGGLDARHLVSVLGYGDRVASIVTIGTPHGGTPVADAAYRLVGDGRKLRDALTRLFLGDDAERTIRTAEALGLGPIDLDGALWNLTTEYARTRFEPEHPDDPRVLYESWSGLTSLTGIGPPAAVEPMFAATYAYLRVVAGPNDGLVPVESARHGSDRGSVPADHANEVGQLFGHVARDFDYRDFYGKIASDLGARGL